MLCQQNLHAEDISRILDCLPQPSACLILLTKHTNLHHVHPFTIHPCWYSSPGIIPPTHPGTMVAVAPRPTGPGTRRNCGAFGASGRGTTLKWAPKVQIMIYDQIWMLHKFSSSICQLSFWSVIIHVLASIFHPISTCYTVFHLFIPIIHLSPVLITNPSSSKVTTSQGYGRCKTEKGR